MGLYVILSVEKILPKDLDTCKWMTPQKEIQDHLSMTAFTQDEYAMYVMYFTFGRLMMLILLNRKR